jgi:hypothetical protein
MSVAVVPIVLTRKSLLKTYTKHGTDTFCPLSIGRLAPYDQGVFLDRVTAH